MRGRFCSLLSHLVFLFAAVKSEVLDFSCSNSTSLASWSGRERSLGCCYSWSPCQDLACLCVFLTSQSPWEALVSHGRHTIKRSIILTWENWEKLNNGEWSNPRKDLDKQDFWLWGRVSFGVLGCLVDPLALGVGAKELCSGDIFVTGAKSVGRPLQTCAR